MTISRTAAKRDGNEPDIIRAARALGAVVLQQSGEGLPDLLVAHKGTMYLVEVKMPGAPLKPAQAETFAVLHAVGVPIYVVETPEQMQTIIRGPAMRYEDMPLRWLPNARPVEGKRKRPQRPGVDKARNVAELCCADGCSRSRATGSYGCEKHPAAVDEVLPPPRLKR